MELLIKDFAKIKYAKIKCDGITVIAGENNAGKSTIGKILFSIYNSTTNLEEKINSQRKNEISDNLELNLRNLIIHNQRANSISIRRIDMVAEKIVEDLFAYEKNDDYKKILALINKNLKLFKIESDNHEKADILISLSKKISEIMGLSDELITREVVTRYFNRVFFQQINNVLDDTTKASLNLKN